MFKAFRQTFLIMTMIATMMFAPIADALTINHPSIDQLQLDKYIFNPATEDVNISFVLGGDATVMFDVLSAGSVVRSVNAGPRSKGSVVVVWDGNVASGANAGPGAYSIHLKTQSIYSEQADAWVNVTVSGSAAPVIPAPTPTPTPTPGQVIIVPVDGSVSNGQGGINTGTQIAIGSNYGTISNDVNNQTSNTFTYVYGDGNTTGSVASNSGLVASNGSGIIMDQYGQYASNPNCYWNGTMYLCTGTATDTNVQPYIWNDYATPNPYNPQVQGNLAVHYAISTTATVTVQIIQNNNLVRELKANVSESGTKIAYWDGQYSYGGYASPGAYRYRITAQNSYGNDMQEGDITVVGNTFYNNYQPYTNYYTQPTTYYTSPTYVAPAPYGYISYPCAGFLDVPMSSAYCKAIQELTKLGIFSGYNDGTFRPYQKITRAETIKVVLKVLNYPIVAPNAYGGYTPAPYNPTYNPTYGYNTGYGSNLGSFWDLNPVAWYMPYVLTARAYNIIQGYPNGAFKPDNTVNRVELLKIVLRAGNYQNLGACPFKPYSDTPAKADTYWYIPYACFARQYLLLDPTQDGKMLPSEKMTRGDVAMLIYRAYAQGLLSYKPGPLPVKQPIVQAPAPVLTPPTTCSVYALVNGQYVCYKTPGTGPAVPVIQNHYATPNSYNPYKGLLTINYTVTPGSSVNVHITKDSTLMKTIKTNMVELGSQTAIWDGRLGTTGFFASPGIYKYRIIATNSYGTRVEEGAFSVINY